MAGYAATAPLNLAGPWGTAAWIVAGTALTAAAAFGLVKLEEKVREDARAGDRAVPRVVPKPETKKCESYGVRVQAQGTDCGGLPSSTIGAPGLTKPVPISVAEALGLSAVTKAMLTRTQLKNRAAEIVKAESYIVRGPGVGGYLGKKTFQNFKLPGGIRYDVDCFGCGNSLVY